MKYLGEQSRRYVFSVRQKHNIDPNCREFLNQFIVHVAALPIRPVEQCIKMVFFPCLHFIHTCLWNCEIHTFKFSDDCNSLFKGYNGSFVFMVSRANCFPTSASQRHCSKTTVSGSSPPMPGHCMAFCWTA